MTRSFEHLGRFLTAAAIMMLSEALGMAARADSLPMDSTVADPNHFDYTVPEAPAFQLLSLDSKSILRPGTRRELALMSEKADLKNFAIECAPFLLGRDGQIPLDAYRRRRSLYTLRVSLGAKTPDGGPTAGATGIRLSLLDSSDPYMNKELLNDAAATGASIQSARTVAQDAIHATLAVATDRLSTGGAAAEDSIRARIADDPVLKWVPEGDRAGFLRTLKEDGAVPAIALLADTTRTRMIEVIAGPKIRAAEDAFDARRLKFKSRWNRDILEAAIAMAFVGADSANKALHANAYSAWFVGGWAMGARGQLLLGGNGSIARDPTTKLMGSRSVATGMRFFYGSNQVKTVVGFDLKGSNDKASKYSGEAGAEIQLIPSFWVVPDVTLSRTPGHRAEVAAAVSVRYANLGRIPVWEQLVSKNAR
jgi:hypothetical protein